MKLMRTKNVTQNDSDDLRPEYDLSQLKGGVRGKYFKRATAGTTLVLLEPDVAEAFPDAKTVNEALRALAKVALSQAKTSQAGANSTIPKYFSAPQSSRSPALGAASSTPYANPQIADPTKTAVSPARPTAPRRRATYRPDNAHVTPLRSISTP